MSFLPNVNSNNVAKSFTLLPRLGIFCHGESVVYVRLEQVYVFST